ncbi:hypothetical protein DFAR_1260006 [Desulfarculales bacterium]
MFQPALTVSDPQQSPDYVRLSLAAAMTLGLGGGSFFRGARLGCINLFLTYSGGCRANGSLGSPGSPMPWLRCLSAVPPLRPGWSWFVSP